jgi:hypothetical protein
LEVNNKGEDAKKKPGNGKFEAWFGFTRQVEASSFGEIPSIPLFPTFAPSCLCCSTAEARLSGSAVQERGPQISDHARAK